MALSFAVLEALRAPATTDHLARLLAVPAVHLVAELERLERRGYVRRLTCVPSACGHCSLKATCAPDASTRWTRG